MAEEILLRNHVLPHVFVEAKKMPKGHAVLFMKYNPSEEIAGAKVISDLGCVDVPAFGLYRFMEL